MSYDIEWLSEARDRWRALDVGTQEDILDRLDEISTSEGKTLRPSGVVDFVSGERGAPAGVIVFLQLAVQHKQRRVLVIQISTTPLGD